MVHIVVAGAGIVRMDRTSDATHDDDAQDGFAVA